jgi:hypothetical protein
MLIPAEFTVAKVTEFTMKKMTKYGSKWMSSLHLKRGMVEHCSNGKNE